MVRSYAFVILIFIMNACSAMPDWIGEEEAPPIEGKRISVLAYKGKLRVDPDHEKIVVKIPSAVINNSWTQQSIVPTVHPALGKITQRVTADVGSGAEKGVFLTSTPIIADGVVYAIDGNGKISAINANNIKEEVWSVTLKKDEESTSIFSIGSKKKEFLGGNISYADGKVFVTTGRGDVVALDSKTGEQIWNHSVKVPVKSAASVYNKILYFITVNNRLYALNSETGRTLWTHSGITETTSIYGASSPSVFNDIVIAAYSSGELYALRATTGEVLWSDTLLGNTKRYTSLFNLNDIDATPVIADDKVYAVSNDGVLITYDIHSGRRLWVREVSSLNTPWVAGGFLYILTTDDSLLCINTPDGRIKWVGEFASHDSPMLEWGGNNKGKKITWSGPVLAGGKLLVIGSHGELISVSPYSGKVVDSLDILENTYLPPIVANKQIYIYNNEAELMTLF